MTVRELIIELMDGDLNREVCLCIPQDVTESDSKTGVTSRTTGVIFGINNVEHRSGICYLNFTDWRVSKFAEWVASEIFNDNWEYNKDAFAELACRKLEKLGIVRAKGDEWELIDPQ